MASDTHNEQLDVIDPDILAIFLDESDETLADVDAYFIELESDPHNQDTISAIFRAVHSVKGSSAFFGLMHVKRLAHRMEDLVSLFREGTLVAGKSSITTLLEGIDELRAMLTRVRDGESEVTDEIALDALIERVVGECHLDDAVVGDADIVTTADTSHASTEQRLQLCVAELVQELSGRDDRASRLAVELRTLIGDAYDLDTGAKPSDVDITATEDDADSPLNMLKAILGKPVEDEFAETDSGLILENLLYLKDELTDDAAVKVADDAIGEFDRMMASVGFVPILAEVLLERVEEIDVLIRSASTGGPSTEVTAAENTSTQTRTAHGDTAEALHSEPVEPSAAGKTDDTKPTKPRTASASRSDHRRTMRVEESRIDEFLDYVGELIIVREMLRNVGKRMRLNRELRGLSSEFGRAMEAFTALSHDLQSSIMEVRRVPVKTVLQKVPRTARDVAAAMDKEVDVTLSGEDVSLDKSLLEAIESPLTHMVRNAVDHGIETVSDREAVGKPTKGSLSVSVSESADEIIFRVVDDGKGIDHEALKEKARNLGVITASQASSMSKTEACRLLFAAGLSTAKKVTDVSGRGVGMDVVRRNVADLGGRIDIKSELGAGTEFTLRLPKAVTVQIFDGFLVQVGEQRFVLPLQSINESFRPKADHVHTIAEAGECISRRGQVFPLLRFDDVLGLDSEMRSPSDSIVVSVEVGGGKSAGILVDDILGVQQVVLRTVEGIEMGAAPFSGGAVLGDGRVAMVVDVDKLGALLS